jgi:hypothetical protein
MDWSFLATTVETVRVEVYGEYTLNGQTRLTNRCVVEVSVTPAPVLKCTGLISFVGSKPVGNGSYFSDSRFDFSAVANVDTGLVISSWKWLSVPGNYNVAWAAVGGSGNTWSLTIPSGSTPGIDTTGYFVAVAFDATGQELCRTAEIPMTKRDK